MWPNPQETADLVTFFEEILNGKLHFLCSGSISIRYFCCCIILNKEIAFWCDIASLWDLLYVAMKVNKYWQAFYIPGHRKKNSLVKNSSISYFYQNNERCRYRYLRFRSRQCHWKQQNLYVRMCVIL